MNLLITLLVFIVVCALVYFFILEMLKVAEASPRVMKISKLIMLAIALIFLVVYILYGGYRVDLPNLK